jgi:hypothetical protein
MTEVQKLGLKDFIVLKIFDAVWMLLELTSPRFKIIVFSMLVGWNPRK